jgi:hypothetical protein
MSLDKRRDNRSKAEFKKDMINAAQKEAKWMEILCGQLKRNKREFTLRDTGVDNTGKLIDGVLPKNTPDFYLENNNGGGQYIEVKTAPEFCDGKFYTFKVSSLKMCIAHNSWIFLPRRPFFYLIQCGGMEKLLEYSPKIYPGFSPNDPAIRIYHKNFISLLNNGLVTKHNWDKISRQLIDDSAQEFGLF